MCIFNYDKLVKKHRVKKSEPMIGYKAVKLYTSWSSGKITVLSPIKKHTKWNGIRLRAGDKIHGARWTDAGDAPRFNPGIHCLVSKSRAKKWGTTVVRVRMWGTVYEYADALTGKTTGYLAQSVEIDGLMYGDYWMRENGVRLITQYPHIEDCRPKSNR